MCRSKGLVFFLLLSGVFGQQVNLTELTGAAGLLLVTVLGGGNLVEGVAYLGFVVLVHGLDGGAVLGIRKKTCFLLTPNHLRPRHALRKQGRLQQPQHPQRSKTWDVGAKNTPKLPPTVQK